MGDELAMVDGDEGVLEGCARSESSFVVCLASRKQRCYSGTRHDGNSGAATRTWLAVVNSNLVVSSLLDKAHNDRLHEHMFLWIPL